MAENLISIAKSPLFKDRATPEDKLVEAVARRVVEMLKSEGLMGGIQQRYFSPKDFAHYTGDTVGAVQQLIKRSRVPTVRMGTKRYIDKVRFDALMADSEEWAA